MSKVNAIYHIVWCTAKREMTITNECRNDVYRFVWSILSKHNCYLLRMGGTPNHIHMLINLHPTVALSDLMREVKASTSGWMHTDSRFPLFKKWAKDYFAATIAYKDKDPVIEYIKTQQEHHNISSFSDEIDEMLENEGFTRYEDDFN